MNLHKTAGIENFSGKFLKDGPNFIAKTISKIYNLSITYSIFPTDCQITKLNHYSKRAQQHFLELIGQFYYSF